MKKLIAITLLAAFSSAGAINISFLPGSNLSSGLGTTLDTFEPLGSYSFSLSTSVSDGISIANATWGFLNGASDAMLSGRASLFSAGLDVLARADAEVRFFLGERARYAIAGFLDPIVFPGGSAGWVVEATDLDSTGFPLAGIYQAFGPFSSFVSLDQPEAFLVPPLGKRFGILEPGLYNFSFLDGVNGGSSEAEFSLSLSVPDMGSTLLLLAVSLCGLVAITKWKLLV